MIYPLNSFITNKLVSDTTTC